MKILITVFNILKHMEKLFDLVINQYVIRYYRLEKNKKNWL